MAKPVRMPKTSRDRPRPINLIDVVNSLPEEMRHAIVEQTVSDYRKYEAVKRRKQRRMKLKKLSS
jgi:hypothetical protein